MHEGCIWIILIPTCKVYTTYFTCKARFFKRTKTSQLSANSIVSRSLVSNANNRATRFHASDVKYVCKIWNDVKYETLQTNPIVLSLHHGDQ